MKYARMTAAGGPVRFARVEGSQAWPLEAAPWTRKNEESTPQSTQASELRVPVEPSKILCVGKNYRAHAQELGTETPKEPLLFFKPPSSLLDPGGTVVLPEQSARVDYEAELGVVIGARCRGVSVDSALDYVFGYTAVCDVTARDLQKKDGQWTRAKGFDTFCPVGPFIETSLDPANAHIELRLNGEVRQNGNSRDMVFGVAELIAYASSIMTLEPGDLLATGTPHGVGPLTPGDRVEVVIEHLEPLRFDVTGETSPRGTD